MTTMFMVRPNIEMTRIPNRKEPGIATPTSPALRNPSAATTTIITSTIAAMMLFCRSVRKVMVNSDWSWLNDTSTVSGQSSVTRRTTSFTAKLL